MSSHFGVIEVVLSAYFARVDNFRRKPIRRATRAATAASMVVATCHLDVTLTERREAAFSLLLKANLLRGRLAGAFTSQNHKVTSPQGQAYLATVCLFCHVQGLFRPEPFKKKRIRNKMFTELMMFSNISNDLLWETVVHNINYKLFLYHELRVLDQS